ncbi:MAG: hypothetical protein AAFX53_19460 [Bacteroidota bacterium]
MMTKNIFLFVSISFLAIPSFGQIIMSSPSVEITDACNKNSVYAFLTDRASFKPFDEIEKMLNREIDFVKNHPKFKSKCAIQHLVNCKGEASSFHMVTESKKRWKQTE